MFQKRPDSYGGWGFKFELILELELEETVGVLDAEPGANNTSDFCCCLF